MRSLEQDFEAKLRQRESALELELSAKWDERIRNLKEREADLTKSLNLAQEQLKDLKSKDESATAKLLEKGNDDEERDGKNHFAEVDLLSRDLERAHARVESVERRNEQLRAEIEASRAVVRRATRRKSWKRRRKRRTASCYRSNRCSRPNVSRAKLSPGRSLPRGKRRSNCKQRRTPRSNRYVSSCNSVATMRISSASLRLSKRSTLTRKTMMRWVENRKMQQRRMATASAMQAPKSRPLMGRA